MTTGRSRLSEPAVGCAEAGRTLPEQVVPEQIVKEHFDRVYAYAYRLTGNVPDAEDLTNEVFVRLLDTWDRQVPDSYEAWLHRITLNLYRDRARRRSRIRFETLPEHSEQTLPVAEGSPEQQVTGRIFDTDVEAALASLPAGCRTAVLLRDVDGLRYDEIAGVLGLRLGTVRSRIHRGRALLRELLAHRVAVAV